MFIGLIFGIKNQTKTCMVVLPTKFQCGIHNYGILELGVYATSGQRRIDYLLNYIKLLKSNWLEIKDYASRTIPSSFS